MPELPEVETSVRLLRPKLQGRVLGRVQVHWARTLGGMNANLFQKKVLGAKVERLERRAKYILLRLERAGESAGWLSVHLRMTGRLYVDPSDQVADPFVKVDIELDNGQHLRFLDVRKFGRVASRALAAV